MSKIPVWKHMRKLGSDFHSLGRLWPFLRQERGLIFAASVLIPLISLMQSGVPLLLKWTIDHGIVAADLTILTWGAGAYFILVVAEYCTRAGQTIITSRAVFRMTRNLRQALVAHIMSLSARFHDKTLSGTLVTRATSDFDNLNEALNQGVLSSVVDLAVLVGALTGLLLLDWRLALIAVAILPFVVIAIVLFSRALKRSMLLARVKIAALNAFTQECLYGHSTIKLLGARQDSQKHFDKLCLEYRNAQMGSVVIDAILFALLDGVASITIGCVLWFALAATKNEGSLSPGIMIAFVHYVQNLFDPLKQLGNKIAMLQGAFTAMDRIFGVFDSRDTIAGEVKPPLLQGDIQCRNLSFSYQGAKAHPVLQNITFHVEPGGSLAIVGATGSGKSTLVKLLTKLYDGYTGDISLDGCDLRTLSGPDLRQQIAIVPQDIVIFQGSIAFNITLGDTSLTQEQVEAAARFIGAEPFIQAMGGYEAELREGGSNISQGQRQLIAFARALIRNPRVIILDEASSSVDPQSEQAIQNAIEQLFTNRTLLIIAHRLSTIRKCKNIMVLDHGIVQELGSHRELMEKRAAYFQLHQRLSSWSSEPVPGEIDRGNEAEVPV